MAREPPGPGRGADESPHAGLPPTAGVGVRPGPREGQLCA